MIGARIGLAGLTRLQPRQVAILLGAVPLTLLGTSGVTEHLLFASPSPAKYAVTVALPLMAATMVTVSQPFLVLTSAMIIIAPAATLRMSLPGVGFGALSVVCVLAAVPVVLGLTRPVGRTGLGRVLPWVVALAAVALVRGPDIPAAVGVPLAAVVVAFLCARAVRMPGGTAVVLGSLFATLMMQAGVAIWEYLTRSEFDLYSGWVSGTANYFFEFGDQPRPTGTFSDPISLGTSLMVAVPIGLACIYLLLERRRWAAAGLTAAAVAMIGTGLALTLSRMATIGGLAAIVVVVAVMPRRTRLNMARIAGAVVVVLLVGASTLGGESLIERASSVFAPTAQGVATASSDRDRETYWQVALDTGLAHPVAGVGAGNLNPILVARTPNSGVFTHAHSTYLQIFAEAGVVGLAALALLLAGLGRDLMRARQRAPILSAGLAGAVTAVAVAALTDVVLIQYVAVAATLAPVLGLVAGLAGQERDDPGQ